MAMGYKEFGKLIESGDTEAVAKVFNAMEGQAQQLMLSYLTDAQLEKLDNMVGGSNSDDDLNIPESNDSANDLLQAINDDDLIAAGMLFKSLSPDERENITKGLTTEQGEKLAEMLNAYSDMFLTDYDDLVDNYYEKAGTNGNGDDVLFTQDGVERTDPRYDHTMRDKFLTPEESIANYGDEYADIIHDYYNKHPWSKSDANGDGDTDVITADTDGNGKPDTAVVAGDDAKEEKEAVKAAKEDLGLDGDDDTSTGKKKKELEEDNTYVLSDKKQKDTCSDSRQKNILSALSELRF